MAKHPNASILERCEISGIKAFLIKAQLRWVGYVDDIQIPKRVFYSQLSQGTRSCGGQYKRYKDVWRVCLFIYLVMILMAKKKHDGVELNTRMKQQT